MILSSRVVRRLLGSMVALAALAGPALADPAGECTGFAFDAKTPAVIARIAAAAPKTYFIRSSSENASCPADTAACRARPYLVPGDLVLAGAASGAFTCATFQSLSPKGQITTSGWLPTASLVPVAPAAAPTDWAGAWWKTSAKLTIKPAAGGKLKIAGEATYPVAGGVRTTEVDGETKPETKPAGAILAFAGSGEIAFDTAPEDACRFRAQRVDALLVVEDNGQCGDGMASFTGLYQRKR
jgi:hypothetical protein